MNTGIKPTTHIYKEINEGKYKGVKHYELVEVKNGTPFFSNLLNIQKDRGFAKSNPTYWLKNRTGNKWQIVTGLFYTPYNYIFIGDSGANNSKDSLIIAQFKKEDPTALILYYFKGYYTNDIDKVIHFINQ
jgi:hypothetical protein